MKGGPSGENRSRDEPMSRHPDSHRPPPRHDVWTDVGRPPGDVAQTCRNVSPSDAAHLERILRKQGYQVELRVATGQN